MRFFTPKVYLMCLLIDVAFDFLCDTMELRKDLWDPSAAPEPCDEADGD